jgi:hypothetical protein
LALALSPLGWICWSFLYLWCPLADYYDFPHFTFADLDVLRNATPVFLVLSALYLAGYWLIKTAPRVSTILKVSVILAVTGGCAINALIYPIGALDVFNYVIHNKLTYYYGQNPYLITADWFAMDHFAPFGFFLDKPLGYGPAWLILSGLPSILAGFDDLLRSLLAYKAFNLLLFILIGLAIYRYQDDSKERWLAAYVFLANPLVLFEGIGNVHNDVMVTFFLVAALLALKRRSWLAPSLLAASALVKFFTAALAPLFMVVMLARQWTKRQVVLSLVAAGLVVVAAFAPFWAGGKVIAGLGLGIEAYGSLNSVSIYSLLRETLRQREASQALQSLLWWVLAGLFAVCALLIMWRLGSDGQVERGMVDMLLVFCALLTLLFPWYMIPVIAILALKHDRTDAWFLLAFTALGLVYYPLSSWAWSDAGWTPPQVHLFQSLFLTVPVLALLATRVVQSATAWHSTATEKETTAHSKTRSR